MKRRQPASRVKLNPVAVWEQLNRRNMTQNDLARAAGITSGYLSLLMSGKRFPRRRRGCACKRHWASSSSTTSSSWRWSREARACRPPHLVARTTFLPGLGAGLQTTSSCCTWGVPDA